MKKLLVFPFAVILILSLNLYSQNPDNSARGCVTEEGKQLNFLIGSWKVKGKNRLRGSDKWEEYVGSSKIKFVYDQCLAAEKLLIKREGRPLTITALYSYNNIAKKYQWVFAHSEHGLLSMYEGPLENNKFAFSYAFEIGERRIMFKRELTRLTSGFEMVASRSTDGGTTWRIE
ncbi:MAG: DUF1579 family protein, partial [Pyrinomonadaceae bacterium]|nr:DUF1579 family protein [Pyrinomonadaceae bacterium]